MRKLVLATALGLSTLIGFPAVSSAQHHGGGGHSGGSSSAGHSGGSWSGGYYGGGYYGGRYGYGYYPGFGIYVGWPGYYNYGYYNYPYYSYPYYSNYSYEPSVTYADPGIPSTSYYSPPPSADQSSPDNHPNAVNLEIRLPENAELWIQGVKMTQPGAVRHFYSDPIASGQKYNYELRAKWMDANGKVVDRTRKLSVQAGARMGVDFNNP
jgi:uncharacterized protein (TIGR03000 family)